MRKFMWFTLGFGAACGVGTYTAPGWWALAAALAALILAGCVAGSLTSMGSVFLLCRLFGLDRELTVSLLPKSVTTPIATAISEGQGGIVSITVAAVIYTGILGNLCAPALVRLLRVKDPVAAGLGIGACSHAMGTARALELGETEGAMSGLAIGVCGIITVLISMVVL